jgi:hypothetical protein
MHVCLLEPEQLALAKPGEQSGREQAPPDVLERMELQQAVGLAPSWLLFWNRADPAPGASSSS